MRRPRMARGRRAWMCSRRSFFTTETRRARRSQKHNQPQHRHRLRIDLESQRRLSLNPCPPMPRLSAHAFSPCPPCLRAETEFRASLMIETETAPTTSDHARRIEELGRIILAYSEVTEKLQQSHTHLT